MNQQSNDHSVYIQILTAHMQKKEKAGLSEASIKSLIIIDLKGFSEVI